jgi:hypothetical protein
MDSLPKVLVFDVDYMVKSKPVMFDVFKENKNKQLTISFLTCLALEYVLRKIRTKKDFLKDIRQKMPRSYTTFMHKCKSAKETYQTYFDHVFEGYVVPSYDYVVAPYDVFNNWCIGVALMYVHYYPHKHICDTKDLWELVNTFRELCGAIP